MPIPTTALVEQFNALSTEEIPSDKGAPSFLTPTKEKDANSSLLSDDDTVISESYPVAPSPSTPDSAVHQHAAITKTDHKLREESGELAPEPLLVENPHRFVLFPIKDNDLWEMYKKAEASFWTAEEIDLGSDMADWVKLSDNERHFISHILAFFAASDGIVNENLAQNFMTELQSPEGRCFYGFQIAVENIHSETYSLLIDTYIKDTNEKMRLLHAIDTVPCVQKKAQWALQWCDRQGQFRRTLRSFLCCRGNLLLRKFLRNFLVEEAWIDARSGVLQRAHFT